MFDSIKDKPYLYGPLNLLSPEQYTCESKETSDIYQLGAMIMMILFPEYALEHRIDNGPLHIHDSAWNQFLNDDNEGFRNFAQKMKILLSGMIKTKAERLSYAEIKRLLKDISIQIQDIDEEEEKI